MILKNYAFVILAIGFVLQAMETTDLTKFDALLGEFKQYPDFFAKVINDKQITPDSAKNAAIKAMVSYSFDVSNESIQFGGQTEYAKYPRKNGIHMLIYGKGQENIKRKYYSPLKIARDWYSLVRNGTIANDDFKTFAPLKEQYIICLYPFKNEAVPVLASLLSLAREKNMFVNNGINTIEFDLDKMPSIKIYLHALKSEVRSIMDQLYERFKHISGKNSEGTLKKPYREQIKDYLTGEISDELVPTVPYKDSTLLAYTQNNETFSFPFEVVTDKKALDNIPEWMILERMVKENNKPKVKIFEVIPSLIFQDNGALLRPEPIGEDASL